MTVDDNVIKDALKITGILSDHLATQECEHCKKLFEAVLN